MQIKDYTKPELDRFRSLCNFTDTEMAFFDLRASGATLDECCGELDYSMGGICRISGKVKKKINRI
jgi:hypothetical protein|nr:MAG TPA: hypothetical protein [Caudoviricetes sp.]